MPTNPVTTWRAFTARDRKQIEARLSAPDGSRCPRCSEILEVAPIIASSRSPSLECRECRRYYSREAQTITGESLYFLRIQRLATAILRA